MRIIGTINILSKEKADIISALGFKYTPHKVNSEQTVYSFIDTPEIRKVITKKFSNKDFYVCDSVFL